MIDSMNNSAQWGLDASRSPCLVLAYKLECMLHITAVACKQYSIVEQIYLLMADEEWNERMQGLEWEDAV